MRYGSSPNFAPPVEEGMVLALEDEQGEVVVMEFLGLLIYNDHRYGFFYEEPQDFDEEAGELTILEVTELDEEGQPVAFELLTDEAIGEEVYEEFKKATKDLYDFE